MTDCITDCITDYVEHVKEFDVTHIWHNAKIIESVTTKRGTLLEMVERPMGLSCFMNNSIQSCTSDEQIYHEALVHPVMSDKVKTVLIIGGGEGATAREVLKWPVERVDMYEWDEEVVQLFKKYPQWSKGAWDDKRLHIYYDDIFTANITSKYDAIIVDLFEPNAQWVTLIDRIRNWSNGSIIMYAGMRTTNVIPLSIDMWRGIPIDYSITYKYIPSFLGESVFLLR